MAECLSETLFQTTAEVLCRTTPGKAQPLPTSYIFMARLSSYLRRFPFFCGLASLQTSSRCRYSCLFNVSMARCPSDRVDISTKANPLERPEKWSVTRLALITSPYWLKSSRTSGSVISYGKLPIKSFTLLLLVTVTGWNLYRQRRCRGTARRVTKNTMLDLFYVRTADNNTTDH